MQKYDLFHKQDTVHGPCVKDNEGRYYLVTEVEAVIDTLNLIADKASRWAEDAEIRIRELTALDKSMCSRLDAANAEIAALKEKLGYRQKECESWAKNFHALDKNYDTLQEETDKEIAALKERIKELEAENRKLQESLAEVIDIRDFIVRQLEKAEEANRKLREGMEQLADDKGDAYWTKEEVIQIANAALESK